MYWDVSACACMRLCLRAFVCVRLCVFAFVRVCDCACVRLCVCACACVHMCVFARVCACVRLRVRVRLCVRAFVRLCMFASNVSVIHQSVTGYEKLSCFMTALCPAPSYCSVGWNVDTVCDLFSISNGEDCRSESTFAYFRRPWSYLWEGVERQVFNRCQYSDGTLFEIIVQGESLDRGPKLLSIKIHKYRVSLSLEAPNYCL